MKKIKLTVANKRDLNLEKNYQRLKKQDGFLTVYNGFIGIDSNRRQIFVFRVWRVELSVEY